MNNFIKSICRDNSQNSIPILFCLLRISRYCPGNEPGSQHPEFSGYESIKYVACTNLSDPFLGAADSEYAQGMEAKILQVAETGLCNLRDVGIPVCDADVCCGPTGYAVQQAWYTACHPIPRRHQTLIRSTLDTQKKQFSGFICRTIHHITH